MAKDEEAAPDSSSGFTLGNLLLLALAIAALIGLYAFANVHRENEEGGRELPHGTIQLEWDKLDGTVRNSIAVVEARLGEQGFDVLGPASMPFLLPGAKPGDEPVAKKLVDLTDAEWETAWRYALMGEYWVPRIFRLDGRACILRFAPKGGQREFPADTAARVKRATDGVVGTFKPIRAYSRLGGVGTEADRDAINVTFGVQTAWVTFKPLAAGGMSAKADATWANAEAMKVLTNAKATLFNPHVRSITTPLNWLRYYLAVLNQVTDKDLEVPNDDALVQRAIEAARRVGCNNLLTQNYRRALIEVTTDAEGTANAEMFYFILANVKDNLGIEGDSPYMPRVVERLKEGPPIDRR